MSKLSNFENVWGLSAFSNQCTFCPGGFSKSIYWTIFKFHIVILQILKMCNVVVLIGKNWKLQKRLNFENWRIFDSMCILSRRFLKDYSSDRFQIVYIDSRDTENEERRSFDWNKLNIVKIIEFSKYMRTKCIFNQCIFYPGGFSKTFHRIIFRFYIVILQIPQNCKVIAFIEKRENCQNYRVFLNLLIFITLSCICGLFLNFETILLALYLWHEIKFKGVKKQINVQMI